MKMGARQLQVRRNLSLINNPTAALHSAPRILTHARCSPTNSEQFQPIPTKKIKNSRFTRFTTPVLTPPPHPAIKIPRMPTYEYVCSKCGHEFEKFQSMSD